jgi:uncharacterized protein (TIGR02598 family)
MILGLRRVHAFSLVELTLALGIAAFCLIAVFGLMPIGVQTNRNATSQTAATHIISSVFADVRTAARATASATPSPLYQIIIPARDAPNTTPQTRYFDSTGQFTMFLNTNSRYQLNVTFPANPGPGTSKVTYGYLEVTWPPTVVQTNPTPVPSGSVQMFAAFDRN